MQQLLAGEGDEINFEKDQDNERGDTDEEKRERMERILVN